MEDSDLAARFPRSFTYGRDCAIAYSMGPNALWLTEFLAASLTLQPGMRVLDHGCGMGMSSVFLAREFGVEASANDLWIPAEDNAWRFKEAGLGEQSHAVNADARALPYDPDFLTSLSVSTPTTTLVWTTFTWATSASC